MANLYGIAPVPGIYYASLTSQLTSQNTTTLANALTTPAIPSGTYHFETDIAGSCSVNIGFRWAYTFSAGNTGITLRSSYHFTLSGNYATGTSYANAGPSASFSAAVAITNNVGGGGFALRQSGQLLIPAALVSGTITLQFAQGTASTDGSITYLQPGTSMKLTRIA